MQKDFLLVQREVGSLRKQATDRLRDAIVYGHFEPGQRLIERDLCESLGVSRALLREALQHLQAENLIQIVLHRGPIVASITLEEARQIYAVRRAMESLMAEEFVRNASEEEVEALSASVTRLHDEQISRDPQKLLRAKDEFYAVFMLGCRNRVVGEMLTLLKNRIVMLRRMTMAKEGRMPQMLDELDSIVRAIRARDAELASRRAALHVENAARVMAHCFAQKDSRAASVAR